MTTYERRVSRFFDFAIFGGFLLVALLIITGLVRGPTEQPPAAAPAGQAAPADGEVTVAHLVLTEFGIEGDLEVPPGPVRLEVHNAGAIVHNLVVEGGPRTPDLNAGESAVLDLGALAPGTYRLFCDIAGHTEAGMQAILTVAEGAQPTAAVHAGHGEDPDWGALDQAMMDSILAFPAQTEGRGNQPLEPTVLPDGTKRFELTVAITPWEVEPGKVVDAWTYNGQVPGPLIRVDRGDRVQVVVHNELPMGTDVHWHGVSTPNEMDGVAPLTQELIRSGETFVYEFETVRPSIGMYHAHHHGHVQIINGLFGALIVGDTPIPYGETVSGITIPEDLEIALEEPMVLNDAGVIGLSLNGKSFPATEPYLVDQGDWIVIHYYNEGLQIHPMHLHQFPQLVFAKDGIPLDQPYWSDTVNVAPGERYSVLIHADQPGVWVWHCHILTHVERDEGMFGMVTAVIVQP